MVGGRTPQGMLFASWFSWGVGPVLPKSGSILWASLRVHTPNHCSLSLPNSLTPDLAAPFLLTHLHGSPSPAIPPSFRGPALYLSQPLDPTAPESGCEVTQRPISRVPACVRGRSHFLLTSGLTPGSGDSQTHPPAQARRPSPAARAPQAGATPGG